MQPLKNTRRPTKNSRSLKIHRAEVIAQHEANKKYKQNPAKARFILTESATKELKQAMSLYKKFSGHEPELVGKVKITKMPEVGIIIGDLDGVAYETVRDNKKDKYFHKFNKKSRPLLCSSFNGAQLFIINGHYDFTEDGIVDKK